MVDAGSHYLRMDGQEVFKRVVRTLVVSATKAMAHAGVSADDVAWFVPHQANQRIIDVAAERLGLRDRIVSNLDRYGNTSSASIPLALFEAVDEGRVRTGDLVLLSGFGAGMTWASALSRGPRPRLTAPKRRADDHRTARREEQRMERETAFNAVREIAVDVLAIDAAKLRESTTFRDDLDADSLDLVELVMGLEERFDISLPEEDLEDVRTVADAVDLVLARVG